MATWILGFIPDFLSETDPRPAKEQFDSNYIGGWRNAKGFQLDDDNALTAADDPPLEPLAKCYFRDEMILFYRHSWVAIVQRDRTFEVSRMD
jgi:hypothetical protein